MDKRVPEVRFKGFTDDWEQHELKDLIIKQYNGQTPSRYNKDFWNGTINWLSSGELNRGIVNETAEKITSAGMSSAHLKMIPKGTFLMAITGLEARGTRGNCAILNVDSTINQSCMAIFPKSTLLDVNFLFQWYRKVGEEYGIRYTQGTKQQSYNAELINILPITVPLIDEQLRINSILLSIDKLIIHQEKILKQYRRIKKYLLQNLFPINDERTPKVRFNDFHDEWEQRNFGSIYKKVTEKNNLVLNSKRIISVANMYFKKDTHKSDTEYMKTYNIFKLGDIAFEGNKSKNFSNGRFVENTIGNGIVSHVFDVFRPINYNDYDISFWKYYIHNEYNMGRILQRVTTHSTMMTNLVAKDFLKHYVRVSNKDEQNAIGEVLLKMDNLIKYDEQKLTNYRKIKKMYLQKLFI